jgi:hypothetical protein
MEMTCSVDEYGWLEAQTSIMKSRKQQVEEDTVRSHEQSAGILPQ